MTREITRDEIMRGLEQGIIRLVPDPNMDYGTACEIGGSWFYFDSENASELTPEEYADSITKEETARRIHEALQEFENEIDYSDEWAYYRTVLDETLDRQA